jgi:hypothetical protein
MSLAQPGRNFASSRWAFAIIAVVNGFGAQLDNKFTTVSTLLR